MSAVTGFRRLGFAVLALVLIVFGALAAVSFLIPADRVRDAVVEEIHAVTGLQPVVRGSVSVSLFPTGQVSFSDVVLGSADSGNSPLTAQQLVARLRFFPLLAGHIEVADVTLVAPHATVVIGRDGRSNWSPLADSLTRTLGHSGKTERLISFSEIRATGGHITWRNEARDTTEELTDVEMSLAWPAISRSFAASGRVNFRNEVIETSITLGDFGAMLQGDKSGLKVRINGTPLKLAFDGSMSLHPTLKVDGTMSSESPSLRRMLLWAGQKPLPGGGFERFSLKAQANVVSGTIALTGVNIELDGNAAEGVLTFATEGRQTWQGTLAADSIDLTPYLSTIQLLTSNERGWNRVPVDVEGLSSLEFDLRLSASKITIGSAKLGRTATAANLRQGKLLVTIGESQSFGGVIKGSFSLARAEQGAELKSQLTFTDIDLESSMSDLFGIRRLEGKGDLTLILDATGQNVLGITRTLNGTATLAGRQGALTGLNVEQLLRRLERRPLSGGSEFRTGRTPFEKFSAQIKIVQGVATVDDVSLQGPAVRLALAGSASIPTRDLDLKGTASLIGSKDGQGDFDLPFVVQGPWDDPIMLPDPQILIRRSGAAAPLLDAVRDKRTRDAVRSAIEKLTGSKGSSDPAPAEPARPIDPKLPSVR